MQRVSPRWRGVSELASQRAVRVDAALTLPGVVWASKIRRGTLPYIYIPERSGSYFPVPSVRVTILSTAGTVKCSTLPLGQWISMSSILVAGPRPKWGRGSFEER